VAPDIDVTPCTTPSLLPGLPGDPLFDGSNNTNFLKCIEYGISGKLKIKKLTRYWEVSVGCYTKWKMLEKELELAY